MNIRIPAKSYHPMAAALFFLVLTGAVAKSDVIKGGIPKCPQKAPKKYRT